MQDQVSFDIFKYIYIYIYYVYIYIYIYIYKYIYVGGEAWAPDRDSDRSPNRPFVSLGWSFRSGLISSTAAAPSRNRKTIVRLQLFATRVYNAGGDTLAFSALGKA